MALDSKRRFRYDQKSGTLHELPERNFPFKLTILTGGTQEKDDYDADIREYLKYEKGLLKYNCSRELIKELDAKIKRKKYSLQEGVDFKVDPCYPAGLIDGQEQYAGTKQPGYLVMAVPMDAQIASFNGDIMVITQSRKDIEFSQPSEVELAGMPQLIKLPSMARVTAEFSKFLKNIQQHDLPEDVKGDIDQKLKDLACIDMDALQPDYPPLIKSKGLQIIDDWDKKLKLHCYADHGRVVTATYVKELIDHIKKNYIKNK